MSWSIRFAHAFWPRWYRFLARLDPVIERAWRRRGIGNVVRLAVVGRRSGRERTLFLGLLRVGPNRYLGHPDVACAWTRNLEAAGGGELERRDGSREAFVATRLEPGAERDAVIRATFTQHPFPGGSIYWLFRANLRANGRFYRLSMEEPRQNVHPPDRATDQVPWASMTGTSTGSDHDRDALVAALAGRGEYELFACDPALADTAAFCAAYGFDPADSANTILVVGKGDPPVHAACVVLATHRLDVNRAVKRRFGRKSSFASADDTRSITGHEIGGVTVFGLPVDLPVWVDAAVMDRQRIVLGGGSRSWKVIAPPSILRNLPNVEVVEGLANPASAGPG